MVYKVWYATPVIHTQKQDVNFHEVLILILMAYVTSLKAMHTHNRVLDQIYKHLSLHLLILYK